MYKINYHTLIWLLTPYRLRRPVMFNWLACLLGPVIWIYNNFTAARELDLFRESIDSTVPRLEYMLNYIFYKPGLNEAYGYRIVVDKFPARGALHIYLGGVMQPENEGRPVYLPNNNPYLYTGGETAEVGVDFIVKVPAAVTFDKVYMRSLVGSYALPDKTFDIITY